jgi:hypothetical protein
MRSVIFLVLIVSICLNSRSCYYDNPPGDLPIKVENVSFSRDILPIFSGSCLGEGCHSGDHAPNLMPENAYTSLLGSGEEGELFVNLTLPDESLIYRELKSGNMPPTGSLSRVEIEFIKAWITKGAFND